jgi:hypothetical protein
LQPLFFKKMLDEKVHAGHFTGAGFRRSSRPVAKPPQSAGPGRRTGLLNQQKDTERSRNGSK